MPPEGSDRPIRVLQICDHLGWEGSRMHGVKRLFAWMIPRFDRSRFQVSLVSLRKRDLSEETLDALGIDITYLEKSKFDASTLARAPQGDRPEADRRPAPAWVWSHDVRPAGGGPAWAAGGPPRARQPHVDAMVPEDCGPDAGTVYRSGDCGFPKHGRVRHRGAAGPARAGPGGVPGSPGGRVQPGEVRERN